MIKLICNGLTHILALLPDGTPDYASYSKSVNTQNALLKAYSGGDFTEYIEPIQAEVIEPNWDGFSLAIMAEPSFFAVYQAAKQSPYSIAVDGLITTLTQAREGKLNMFAVCYDAMCLGGNATAANKAEWAQLATDSNLPVEFIQIVQGV